MKTHFYDLIYADKDYEKESIAIKKLIKDINPKSKNILDLCCGTGKHLSFLEKDFTCHGIDINEKMIEVAKSRTSACLHVQDMKNFSIKEKIDVIICLFGSIAYNMSFEDLYETFKSCRRNLKKGGFLLIEPFVFKNKLKTGFYERNVGEIKIESNVTESNSTCTLDKTYHLPNETVKKTLKLSLFDDNEYIKAMEQNKFNVKKIPFPEGQFQMLYFAKKTTITQ
jgi:ubiquinone/menaquinone biosynthesis C-methylase UbiE